MLCLSSRYPSAKEPVGLLWIFIDDIWDLHLYSKVRYKNVEFLHPLFIRPHNEEYATSVISIHHASATQISLPTG